MERKGDWNDAYDVSWEGMASVIPVGVSECQDEGKGDRIFGLASLPYSLMILEGASHLKIFMHQFIICIFLSFWAYLNKNWIMVFLNIKNYKAKLSRQNLVST